MNIDHFMYAGGDLNEVCEVFRQLTDVEAQPGGSHPQLGTHNRLVGSGTPLYLELIGPDPGSTATSAMRAGIEALRRPCLYRFIMDGTGHDFDQIEAAYRNAGITAQVHDMHRLTPTGTKVRWRLLVPDRNQFDLFAPLFIDWLDTPHPSTRLQAQFSLVSCEAGHPRSQELATLWNELGVGMQLHASDAAYMRLLVKSPRGNIALTSD